MDELLRQVYLESRKEARDARHRSLALLLILVCGYVASMRYAQLSHEKRQAESRSGELRQQQDRASRLTTSVADLYRRASTDFLTSLKEDVSMLHGQFGILDQKIRVVVGLRMPPAPAPMMQGRITQAMQGPATQAVQGPAAPDAIPSDPLSLLPAFSSGQEKQIKEAHLGEGNFDTVRLRAALTPYVSDNIVRPWFDRVNALWREKHVREIETRVNMLTYELTQVASAPPAELHAGSPSAGTPLDTIIAQLQEAKKNAASVQFLPPTDTSWWHTVGSKFRVAEGLSAAATQSVQGLVTGAESLTRLTRSLETALNVNRALVETLQEAQKRQADEIAALTKRAGTLVKPLEYVDLDPDFLSRNLPWILGAAIAVLLYWQGACQRRLTACRKLLAATDKSNDAGDRWQGLAALDATGFPWTLLAVAATVCIWVSGVELVHLEFLSGTRASVLIALGSVVILGTAFWTRRPQRLTRAT